MAYSYQRRKQLIWGLLLIGVGVVLLLDRIGVVEVDDLWHYWPLLLVVAGVNKIVAHPSARQVANGLLEVFFGLWLFAVLEGLYGFTWRTAWPFLIVAWGVKIVLAPFLKGHSTPNTESGNEK